MREGAIIFKHPLPSVLKAPSGIPCMLLTIPYKEKEELIVHYLVRRVSHVIYTSVIYSENL